MKRIDAHLHYHNFTEFDEEAKAVGHENSLEHLRKVFDELDMERGVVMGNGGLDPEKNRYPDFLRYCVGLDEETLAKGDQKQCLALAEQNLRRVDCVGIKIYAGYTHRYVSDPVYQPYYDLAASCHKTVAIHTGAMSGSWGRLKYSHPLTVDEAASQWPQVQFVICHLGNPWLPDAAAVIEKNDNVAADLSGLLEGPFDPETYWKEHENYINYVKTWLQYLDNYDSLMYGTDWPLVNLYDYLSLIERIIPERYWEKVFYENAKRIYQL